VLVGYDIQAMSALRIAPDIGQSQINWKVVEIDVSDFADQRFIAITRVEMENTNVMSGI